MRSEFFKKDESNSPPRNEWNDEREVSRKRPVTNYCRPNSGSQVPSFRFERKKDNVIEMSDSEEQSRRYSKLLFWKKRQKPQKSQVYNKILGQFKGASEGGQSTMGRYVNNLLKFQNKNDYFNRKVDYRQTAERKRAAEGPATEKLLGGLELHRARSLQHKGQSFMERLKRYYDQIKSGKDVGKRKMTKRFMISFKNSCLKQGENVEIEKLVDGSVNMGLVLRRLKHPRHSKNIFFVIKSLLIWKKQIGSEDAKVLRKYFAEKRLWKELIELILTK